MYFVVHWPNHRIQYEDQDKRLFKLVHASKRNKPKETATVIKPVAKVYLMLILTSPFDDQWLHLAAI